jgi:rhodanese-related sulfurtransferase
MKRLLIFSFLISSFVAGAQKTISKEAAKNLLKNKDTQLLDVRTLKEYEQGSLQDAVHVDYFSKNFVSDCLRLFNKRKPLIIYCAAGGRSAKASKLLKKQGFNVVYDLSCGYEGW